MKRLFLAALLCCTMNCLGAVAPNKPADNKSPAPTTKPVTAINKFCAVDTDNPVDPSVPTVVYKGKVIGFCCEDCIPKFNRDPEFYMKDLK